MTVWIVPCKAAPDKDAWIWNTAPYVMSGGLDVMLLIDLVSAFALSINGRGRRKKMHCRHPLSGSERVGIQ